MTKDPIAPTVEEADFDVAVTITFRANVAFAPIERTKPITSDDALNNFYGYGLSAVLDSGEYGYSVDTISIKRAALIPWHREHLYGANDEWFMPCAVCGEHLGVGLEAWVRDNAGGNGEFARCLSHGDPNHTED